MVSLGVSFSGAFVLGYFIIVILMTEETLLRIGYDRSYFGGSGLGLVVWAFVLFVLLESSLRLPY